MKILIIEDEVCCSQTFIRALDGFGEITAVRCKLPNYEWSELPTKDEVIKMIAESDLILLDEDLGRAGYCGKDLLPYCDGKKVIGISSQWDLGSINFSGKRFWNDKTTIRFRKLVEEVIAS